MKRASVVLAFALAACGSDPEPDISRAQSWQLGFELGLALTTDLAGDWPTMADAFLMAEKIARVKLHYEGIPSLPEGVPHQAPAITAAIRAYVDDEALQPLADAVRTRYGAASEACYQLGLRLPLLQYYLAGRDREERLAVDERMQALAAACGLAAGTLAPVSTALTADHFDLDALHRAIAPLVDGIPDKQLGRRLRH